MAELASEMGWNAIRAAIEPAEQVAPTILEALTQLLSNDAARDKNAKGWRSPQRGKDQVEVARDGHGAGDSRAPKGKFG